MANGKAKIPMDFLALIRWSPEVKKLLAAGEIKRSNRAFAYCQI